MTTERVGGRFGVKTEKYLIQDGKVGATAGWTVRAGVDNFMATCAAGSTAATLIVPLPGLKEGDRIEGYHLIGQIESAGNTATVDAQLYESLPVSSASTHTAVPGTSMTQLSVTADTKVSSANTQTTFEAQDRKQVSKDAAYYVLITVTTAASTDMEFLGLSLHVRPAR